MKLSIRTAISSRLLTLRKALLTANVIVGVAFASMLAGCLAPPIMFPKTSGQGIVLDQHDQPVAKAPMKAFWAPIRLFWMFAPVSEEEFKATEDGTWRFHVRKVQGWMGIEAMPPQGYVKIGEESWVKITNGENRTNIVLRLRKIEDDGKLKEGH